MSHITPSFRRAARSARRSGMQRLAERSPAGWSILSSRPALMIAAVGGLALLLGLPTAQARSNAQIEAPPAPEMRDATPVPADEGESLAGAVGAPDAPETAGVAAPRPAPRPQVAAIAPAGAAVGPAAEQRGTVTRLPIPRYVSLKGSEGNARRGPSLSHRIDWVFRHAGMPLRVVGEYGHWRRVEDRDGAGGWVHYQLLSGVRTAIVQQERAELRARPDLNAGVVAVAEGGAIVRLGACSAEWCRISGAGANGWVPKAAVWGVEPDELRD